MKTRQEIKALAKEAVGEQRSSAILIVFLIMLVAGAAGLIGALIGLIPVIGWLVSLAISFVTMVLAVNMAGSFAKIFRKEKVDVGDPFTHVPVNFFRKVGGSYWMALWVFLWSLLLWVPGIIKAIAYSMTYYILADCPNVTATNALKLSMKMTSGHKGKLFVMYLRLAESDGIDDTYVPY